MDLKQGTEALQKNVTFKTILSVLRSVGNFLNGSECKGFHIDYLSKVLYNTSYNHIFCQFIIYLDIFC